METHNSRDAYSLPTDEELAEAYRKAYQFIKIYPETCEQQQNQGLQTIMQVAPSGTDPNSHIIEIKANDLQAIKQAILQGYRHVDTVENVRLYLKIWIILQMRSGSKH
jgi:hypothetical protein